MPPDFLGKMIVTYDFAPNGAINKKELVNILKFDYCNKLLENKDIEVVEGEIDSSQLQINEYLYTYLKELDIFMCLNLEKYEEFVKVQAIYDKCKKCFNINYLIPYNFTEDWICNSCILHIKNN
jgi:hypothetical protein